MRFTIIGCLLLLAPVAIVAQTHDSISNISVNEVVVTANAQTRQKRESALPIESVDLQKYQSLFTGNLMGSLDAIAGVQSMSVGSGFSKPMIRGMGFNRVSVVENGVKQEGQQWGADHGLEIDAFNVERVNIRKGPSSLLFGGDAMGGVVEILAPTPFVGDGVKGSVDLLTRSVNGLAGASLMLSAKRGRWFAKARYSEQHFGDFKVPTDTVVYLTQKLPLSSGRLNNTAGRERGANLFLRYGASRFSTALSLSNSYQKVGFFAAAHGVPDPSKLEDDGDSRDIDLPYSFVNHFKAILTTKYFWDRVSLTWDLGYQNNHREEWSAFHSHYGTQTPPTIDPDRELAFYLDTYSSTLRTTFNHSSSLESSVSWDVQYQDNSIDGYSFLLPAYERLTSGLAWVSSYRPSSSFLLTAGVRYDVGTINSSEYIDEHLATYLQQMGYDESQVNEYKVRSYALDRTFGDYSLSLGAVWQLDESSQLRANLGRSYRLPSVNELAANGVHHGSFRHEQGDPTLSSERGWQLDVAYDYVHPKFSLSLSPFASLYESYIYLSPSGKWSPLPHAGQIYNYQQSQALFAGAELTATVPLGWNMRYELGAEYIYTYNIDQATALPFSPPASLRSQLWWSKGIWAFSVNWDAIASQNRVAQGEDPTPGAQLFGLSAQIDLPSISKGAQLGVSVDNIFNTKYLNHLSFYRQIEVPEMGRNIQISLKIPFNLIHNE